MQAALYATRKTRGGCSLGYADTLSDLTMRPVDSRTTPSTARAVCAEEALPRTKHGRNGCSTAV